jgi:hypothetical protein
MWVDELVARGRAWRFSTGEHRWLGAETGISQVEALVKALNYRVVWW